MLREEMRRWIDSRRAAERRERLEHAVSAVDSAASFEGAVDLIRLAARLHGWPLPEDEPRRRETELARDRWMRLRRVLTFE